MSTTQHPLTEAAAVEMWDASPCPEGYEFRGMLTVEQDATLYAMRAAFDAGREYERANPDAARPWESLNGPVRVGDEVRQEWYGVTRGGIVGRVDGNGDPWTAEGGYIGPILGGTWYVRRTVNPLPTEPGTVIVPAEGHEYITATVGGVTYRAREAILIGENQWHAAWRSDEGVLIYVTPERIDAGTWKVGNR